MEAAQAHKVLIKRFEAIFGSALIRLEVKDVAKENKIKRNKPKKLSYRQLYKKAQS